MRATILMYHSIGMPPEGAKLKGLYVDPRMFHFQMWYLKKAGFKVVGMAEILEYIHGKRIQDKLVALTFDDGYQDFHDNAFPILKKFNYPSTVFLVSSLIGKENIWDKEQLHVRKPLMDWDIIKELTKNGVVFGAHSKTHPHLSEIPMKDLSSEIIEPKQVIEEKLHTSVDYFCYPYGDYNKKVIEVTRSAKYLAAVSVQRGFVRKGDCLFDINRVPVNLNTHPIAFINKLHTNYETRRGQR
jgi:peptidoglycan/xylan/chitin deacetylase (PgdA/CDA1 family)